MNPVDLFLLHHVPWDNSGRKVQHSHLANPGAESFLGGLPHAPGVVALRELAAAVRDAQGAVVIALGGHVIKTGCGPIVCDLMRRGYITALAMHGATAIHDAELALMGATSEDVAAGLRDGSFGMCARTANAFTHALAHGGVNGLGAQLGAHLLAYGPQGCADISPLATAAFLGLPATVHVAIGTDTIHALGVDIQALALASHYDFRLLCGVVGELEGGVWLNVGSAVILPEVFLKALTVARNLGHRVQDFTAANLDMRRHYRTTENVLQRPGGRPIELLGMHEIMLPILRHAILNAA